jgi:cellulose synthase/poly-beta-1,6-N-acetylglucosamine synthase-like glycosyltransferase
MLGAALDVLGTTMVAAIIATAVVLFGVATATVVFTLDTWRNPDAPSRAAFPVPVPPQHGFSVLVPARHEAQVLGDTLGKLLKQTHPRFEILPIVSDDDPDTAAIAEQYAQRHPDQIRVVWDTSPSDAKNKPKALNAAAAHCRLDIVTIVDAESDVAPDLFRHVDTVFQQRGVDVVQGGVQLMDFHKSWWSTLNCLEYWLWFMSRLHFQARNEFIPLGGNTVFVRRDWLDRCGWYDPQCLAEDCDIGVRLSVAGARTAVAYTPALATLEETPGDLRAWFRQRVRWNQGFLQVLLKGDWRRLPHLRERALALFTLGTPIVQTATGLAVMLALITALLVRTSDLVVLLSFLPLVPGMLLLGIQEVALRDFYRAFRSHFTETYAEQVAAGVPARRRARLSWRHFGAVALSPLLYQPLLAAAGVVAVVRQVRGNLSWAKTDHVGAHRGAAERDALVTAEVAG